MTAASEEYSCCLMFLGVGARRIESDSDQDVRHVGGAKAGVD
jgi:hypothetical protein